MPNIPDWKQANSDIAHVQGGSQGASRDAYVIGARSGRPTFIPYEEIRTSFALGSGEQVAFFDHFLGNIGASAVPAPWSEDAGSTGTALPTASPGDASGLLALTTAATLNDHITVALGTHWVVSEGWTFFEASLQLGQLTETILEVGLSDALSEANGLAFSDHTVAGVTDVATDAVIFAFDTDAGANWLVNTVNDGTPQAVDSGVAATGNFVSLRIEVSPDGDAYFYVDGTFVASVESAVPTDAVFTPWVSLVALEGVAKSANIDYLGVVGDNA